jgi:hypothetical protein
MPGFEGAVADVTRERGGFKVEPQESQNRAPTLAGVPHDGHCGCSCPPQPLQNLAASPLSIPQFEQRIYSALVITATPPTESR